MANNYFSSLMNIRSKFKARFNLKIKNLVFEMHSNVLFSPILAGVFLAIDYFMNILLIAYVRIIQISKDADKFFLSNFQLGEFINTFLYNRSVSYCMSIFSILQFIYFTVLLVNTDPDKPRRKSSSWMLKLIIGLLYAMNTCVSILFILA